MEQKDIKYSLRQTYDDLASAWASEETGKWGADSIKKFASLVVESGSNKVLDLGCGPGIQSHTLVEEGLEVTGLDLSPKMIDEARKKVPGGNFLVADMTNMDFSPSSFDGIYARASLLHIPKEVIPQVLSTCSKILKDKGYIYIAVKEGNGEELVRERRYDREVERFFSFFQEDEIAGLVQDAGFDLVDKTKFLRSGGSTTWIEIIAKKK